MNDLPTARAAGETELKLLLPGADVAALARQMARLPLLARRPRQVLQLINRYFDTPDGELRQQRCALRLRRIEEAGGGRAQWVQTFKTAGRSTGGLSVRGEWEAPVRGARLQRSALGDAPWPGIDPDGRLWERLIPVFETHCTRTLWTVRRRDGSEVELALDVGHIEAGGRRLPMAELELELRRGEPAVLFELAVALANHWAVMPGQASKAERGYALLRGQVHAAVRARPDKLSAAMPPREAAPRVLAEMWDQLLRNLAALPHSDEPEVVHQARVAWRRLRGAMRLFRPLLGPLPALEGLRPFWQTLGPVRELDVALNDTLPAWQEACVAGDAGRAAAWTDAMECLRRAATEARAQARLALAQPAVGQALLRFAQWLANPPGPPGQPALRPATGKRHETRRLDRWACQRLERLQRRLDRELAAAQGAERREWHLHEARLLAKRLRYNTEALASVLPRQKAQRWRQRATELQSRLGDERDLAQAVQWLQRLGVHGVVSDFMRGAMAASARAATPD